MKHILPSAILLTACLAFSACSDTNDRGVIIDRPFSLFGSNMIPAAATQPTTPVAASSTVVAANSNS